MTLASPVEVGQEFGFGPFPVPGSYEYVLSCIWLDGAWRPVAEDRVHLTDAVSGRPVWYSAVTARAEEPLKGMPPDGRTLNARSILSWDIPPQGNCGYKPIWGNVIEYQIRLDPTDVPPPPSGKTVFATSTTYTGGLGGQNATDFLTHSTVAYKLVDGTKVADNWADLTDGTLDHAINKDEFGNSVSGSVWTNTETNGQAHDHRRDCGPGSALSAVWNSGDQFESGRFGTSTATDSQWTMTTNTACTNLFRLYCFEQ